MATAAGRFIGGTILLFFSVFALLPTFADDGASAAEKAAAARRAIDKVNRHWQKTHPPRARYGWTDAVYHAGNIEAFFLTGDEAYLAHSLAWAEHNQWKGAKCDDRTKWKRVYGETDEYVLFADNQACFQTYADLNRIDPDPRKLRRAREVMEHQMSLPLDDFWHWSDALFMGMPVMTKLYKATGDETYLRKLREYVEYADSIMYDDATGLYFRDAKYVWPKHKTPNGKKDFWSRGNGWVLAGLAKVLQDLPKDCESRPFFLDKFRRMARAVAACQSPGGWWSRSLHDPEFAPGPESSGTALFLYGLAWGINNDALNGKEFRPVAEKAWKFLSETALQPDGTVGYVQPIGERAIPGERVDAKSTGSFGVGCFLLAACEYVRLCERR